MTTSDSCPRCGLALHVHHCTAEVCNNPVCMCGHGWHAGVCWTCGCREFEAREKEPSAENIAQAQARFDPRVGWVDAPKWADAPKPPSDLDTFRAMLERAGVEARSDYLHEGLEHLGDKTVRVTFDGFLCFDRETGRLLSEEDRQRRNAENEPE